MNLSELAKTLSMDIVQVKRDCEVTSAELCTEILGTAAVTYLADEKYLPYLSDPGIAAVLCPPTLQEYIPSKIPGLLVVDDPKFAFYCICNKLSESVSETPIPTKIGANTDISPDAIIAPYDVQIGEDVTIEPGAVIQAHVTIGDHVTIGPGCVIGSRSYNPARYHDQSITMNDYGSVEIGDYVEVRALSVIQRGCLIGEVTRIAEGVKIDQLVMIAHGCEVGERSFVVAHATLAGHCKIGKDVWIGPHSTISNRTHIGDGARISLGSVVTRDVPAGYTVSGNFAIEHQKFLKNMKSILNE